MYKIALIEDEQIISQTQARQVRAVMEELGIEYRISVFDGSASFWSAFAQGRRYDLILLDIIMDQMSGVELARKIRQHDHDAAIVFVTVSPDFALQGYDVGALHYLVKPLDTELLAKLLSTDYEQRFQNHFFIIKSGSRNLRLATKDIICFETSGRRLTVTTAAKTYDCPGKLTDILASLPPCFIRCHVGYVINLQNIKKLTRTEALAVNGKKIAVSRAYSEMAQTAFLKQLLDS